MIINITFFSWCDSHFQGLAKRGESSEQKCNTSVWSEAQTKVKLKILIPMYSKPRLRGIGHLLHNISLFADRLKGSSADDSRIIKNCHCYCWSLYKLSYLMSKIFPNKKRGGTFLGCLLEQYIAIHFSKEPVQNDRKRFKEIFLDIFVSLRESETFESELGWTPDRTLYGDLWVDLFPY